uniref:Uncharacterized protein n=1 Tax=Oryza alta TaxID=52545 RepID=A0A1V1H5T0_9ORYZ|nr:hypothetical protein [Oryza alta]
MSVHACATGQIKAHRSVNTHGPAAHQRFISDDGSTPPATVSSNTTASPPTSPPPPPPRMRRPLPRRPEDPPPPPAAPATAAARAAAESFPVSRCTTSLKLASSALTSAVKMCVTFTASRLLSPAAAAAAAPNSPPFGRLPINGRRLTRLSYYCDDLLPPPLIIRTKLL